MALESINYISVATKNIKIEQEFGLNIMIYPPHLLPV